MCPLFRFLLRIGAPLAVMSGLVAGIMMIGRATVELASVDKPENLLSVVGRGIDVGVAKIGPIGTELSQLAADANFWITMTAIGSTILSVVLAIRQLSAWVRGPEDVIAILWHAADRAAASVGTRIALIRWGTVYDRTTSDPLPFARIRLIDREGNPRADAVSDAGGNFGFSPDVDTQDVGALLAIRGGYYDTMRAYPVVAGSATPAGYDVAMTRRRHGDGWWRPDRWRWRILSSTAFWLGMLTVPMVYFTEPGVTGRLTVALFLGSAIVRAVGLQRQF